MEKRPNFAFSLPEACGNYLGRARSKLIDTDPSVWINFHKGITQGFGNNELLEHFASQGASATIMLSRLIIMKDPLTADWEEMETRRVLYATAQDHEHRLFTSYLISNNPDKPLDITNVMALEHLQAELQATKLSGEVKYDQNPLGIPNWKNLRPFSSPGMLIDDAASACAGQAEVMQLRADILKGTPLADSSSRIAVAYEVVGADLNVILENLLQRIDEA
jgi:hypothetical protein